MKWEGHIGRGHGVFVGVWSGVVGCLHGAADSLPCRGVSYIKLVLWRCSCFIARVTQRAGVAHGHERDGAASHYGSQYVGPQ